jgi:L-ascorbate metabolism protein UlaG (beta-lactamase superfamily)
MKIQWLGHACFLITADSGIKIITDPYLPDERLKYGNITDTADIVVVSHEHGDHNYVAAVKGKPEVVRGTGTKHVKGIQFDGVATFHDASSGKRAGPNTVTCFEVDGVRVCHAGDLGHSLSDKEGKQIGRVDVLLLPVGGFYTIDAKVATEVATKLSPKVIIPMHFKNEKCDFPITGVDEFLKGKTNVTRVAGSQVEFKQGQLPATTQIMVLKPAM